MAARRLAEIVSFFIPGRRAYDIWQSGLALLVLAMACGAAMGAAPAGRVRLELVASGGGAALVMQEWMQALAQAGIRDVRIRSGEGKVGIENQGTREQPSYVVTGLIISRDELLLPGGRYRRIELGRLAQWLTELAAHGPPDQREPPGLFGLSAKQFEAVHEDLARLVGFATAGLSRWQAVEKLKGQLRLPVRISPEAARVLEQEQIAEELTGLSVGTALAYILRPAGYCLVPRPTGPSVEYHVLKAQPKLEVWPVGWEPKEGANKALPALHEFLNVNIQQVPASTALRAIAERLKVPALLDHNAVARHGLAPDKTLVAIPAGRTTYSLALRKVLFQAGLKFEVRVDEANRPFLWVTSVKPM